MIAIATASSARAQAPKLGTISFPNSGNAAAQAPFTRGVLLYHSFEYGPAAEAFREAEKADPSFALAYWGEALTYTHQVWNQQDLAAGRAALTRLGPDAAARRAKAPTAREQGYLELAEALYGEGAKQKRDTLFTAAAARLSSANPSDDEAKVLHALGLLGLNQGVRDFTTYMQAGSIAEDVLRRNPDHPAAAHFVIHAFDDPVHAPLGLWAARAYSKIAPAAPHAQHMTSHIFVALGMWDDVISQNVIASGHDHEAYRAGHYTWWLGYGYVQAGRYAEARRHLETMRRNLGAPGRPGEAAALVMSRAHFIIDAGLWKDDVTAWKIPVPDASLWAVATDSFVTALVALRRRDENTAGRIASYLARATATAAPADRAQVRVLELELRAELAAVDGQVNEAIGLAREAAAGEDALPFEFGPPPFVKPTTELLGEILFRGEKYGEAQAAFQRSLARTPGRSRSLIGLARAASAAGDRATALSAATRLKLNWHVGDQDIPELAEISRIVASSKE